MPVAEDKRGLRLASIILSTMTLLGSLPCLAMSVWEMFTADTAVGIMMSVFFALVTAVGLLTMRWGVSRPSEPVSGTMTADTERKILQFARNHDGVVTVSQLAAESPLSATQGRDALEQLERVGVCHSVPSSTGGLVYRFPDFMPDGKRTPSEVEFDFSSEEESAVEAAAHAAAAKQSSD